MNTHVTTRHNSNEISLKKIIKILTTLSFDALSLSPSLSPSIPALPLSLSLSLPSLSLHLPIPICTLIFGENNSLVLVVSAVYMKCNSVSNEALRNASISLSFVLAE